MFLRLCSVIFFSCATSATFAQLDPPDTLWTRAYGGGAAMVLDQSNIVTRYVQQQINIKYSYHYSNLVDSLIKKFNAKVQDTSYTQEIQQVLAVRKSLVDHFAEQIIDQSAGNITIL